MNRKNMPMIMMLVAGAVTCIITFIQKYSVLRKLVSLFVVLLVFYILGCVLQWTLNYFDKQNEENSKEEEAVEGEAGTEEEQVQNETETEE